MTAHSSASRRFGLRAGATIAMLVAALAAAPTSATAAPAAPAPVAWTACTEPALAAFQCATYTVPLDYDRPGGATTTIALSRRPATDPARRIGSIFVNPGGPGGPGRGLVRAAPVLFTPEVLARFDVVGFDPRGVGASTPIQCFATDDEALALLNQMTGVPLTKAQISATLSANFQYTEGCKRNAGPLLTHMATINVARDLDVLRAAVGDRSLSYLGLSYGTLIGATYANLFPQRVRALIIDGNVDPDQRTNQRLINKFERAGGFEKALTGFLSACEAAGAPACALAGNARGKVDALRNRLRQGPATLPDGSQVTLDDFTFYVSGQLYSVTSFPATAQTLQALYTAIISGVSTLGATSAATLPKAPAGRVLPTDAYSFNGNDSFYAVNCADAPLPRVPSLYPAIAAGFEAAHPTFGRAEAFGEVGCANWPRVDERYAGPWNRRTAKTVLVVNGTFDPATPYVFGQRMARELGNARLLTMDGYGHTGRNSACVVSWYAKLLLAGEVPPVGTRCKQDVAPFPA